MMERTPKIISVRFYANENGAEPVRDWLKGLTAEDRYAIGTELKTIEFGWPLGMPLVKSMSGYSKLWEARIFLEGGRISRVMFTVYENHMVLLHGFIKKSKSTPKPDLDLADERKRDVFRRGL